MTSSTQNIRQDNEIPRLLGWRGAVAIISCAAVTLSIAQLALSAATIMVSICAVPLLVLAVERGNALLAAAARLDQPERAKAPTLTGRAEAPTLPIRPPASPGLPRVGPGLQHAPLRSRRVASRVKLESH
jgi:hypothetical protein